MHPKQIIIKTVQVGTSTMFSRILGIVREYLNIRYFGVGALSDAFVTAFSIPNMMRSIFAEGALSAAFIPVFIKTLRTKDKEHANGLMTLSFLVFEGLLLFLLGIIAWWPAPIVRAIAWGFSDYQVSITAPLLQLLIFFVLFISSSALFAAALQATGKFFIPAFGQVLINAVIIIGLFISWQCALPVQAVCSFILLAGFIHMLMHAIAYFRAGFGFAKINTTTWHLFVPLFFSFFACALSTSVAELDFFIDRAFGSYLPQGSISLLFYANRFMAIPLGVFAVAFSTILMPHFSRLSIYAPKRLSFYLLEASKLVLWVTLPITIVMCFFAEKIFMTLFLSQQFTVANAQEAGMILIAFMIGLFFFSLNKIILNIFYALRATLLPLIVSVIAVSSNALFNYMLMEHLGATGLALATSISGCIQMICLLSLLYYRFNFTLYVQPFGKFLMHYVVQLLLVFSSFWILYEIIHYGIRYYSSPLVANFLLNNVGFWFWVGPLCLLLFLVLLLIRKPFAIKLHFLAD